MPSEYVGLRLAPDLMAWVDEQAAANEATRSDIIRFCIEQVKTLNTEIEEQEAAAAEIKPLMPVIRQQTRQS